VTGTPAPTPAPGAQNAASAAANAQAATQAHRSILARITAQNAMITALENAGVRASEEFAATAAELVNAGCDAVTIDNMSRNGELSTAAQLLARDIPATTLVDLMRTERLTDVQAALDNGVPQAWLERIGGTYALNCRSLTELHDAGMPERVLEQLLHHDLGTTLIPVITGTLEHGGTWDDVTRLTDHNAVDPNSALAHYFDLLTEADITVYTVTRPVLVLAAILASSITHTLALDMLPVAAALHHQPWEDTVLTLLHDAGRPMSPHGAGIVIAARALEHDPHLPATPSTPTPWTAPPSLQAAVHAAARTHTGENTPSENAAGEDQANGDTLTLSEHLHAAGVDAHTITDAVNWLGENTHDLDATRTPQHGSWHTNALTSITAALAAGTSVTELRLTATILTGGQPIPIADAALIHACGTSRDTAEEWARRGAHPVTTTLLVEYGLNPAEALKIAAHEDPTRSWHAIELLAGGVTPAQLERTLPVLAGLSPAAMWHSWADTDAGIPVPPGTLAALADHQLVLTDIAGLERDWTGKTPMPEAVLTLGVNTYVQHLRSDPLIQWAARRDSYLAYAAAAAGQPWAQDAPELARTNAAGNPTDPRILLAEHVLTARGITPPRRSISAPARTSPGTAERGH
jgi:hypothetical protein